MQMSDSYGNPKVSQLSHTLMDNLTVVFQDDCTATFSSTSISGNISSVSAVGCDPLALLSLNTLDGESGPVLSYCQSIRLNSEFTAADIQQGGSTIVKYQSCDSGGHEFLFNVQRSGTYTFLSSMTYSGVSHNLKLIVDVDSGAVTTKQTIILHLIFDL